MGQEQLTPSVRAGTSHDLAWPETYQHSWRAADEFPYVIVLMALETWHPGTRRVCIFNNASQMCFTMLY